MNSALRSLAGKFTHKSWVTLTKRNGHSVRLIALEDLPHGKAYKGDVVSVKAGYARNFLVPKKKAVYATPLNFQKLGIVDPEFETEEERIARMERESSMDQKEEQLLKNSDLLKSYLRNKTLKIWRVVDPNSVDALNGKVNCWNIRKKLSKQLKIDLEDHETIHICSKEPVQFSELNEKKIEEMLDAVDAEQPCSVDVKRLGEYIASIGLEGGYSVPLKFQIIQKIP